MIFSDVTIPMISICAFQAFLVPFQWINFVTRRSDRTRFRFLILSIVYLSFNVTWIAFLESLSFSTWREIPIIGYLGILMIGFTYFYLNKEIGLKGSKSVAIRLVLQLAVAYCCQQLIAMYLPTNSLKNFELIFCGTLQVIALVHGIRLIRPIVRNRITVGSLSPIYRATVITACIYCFSPLLFGLVSESSIEFILINAPFVVISFAYILHHVNQLKSETNFLNSGFSGDTLTGRYFKNKIEIGEIELTERQSEIAHMMLQEDSYKNISEKLFITESSVRKHASNIFKKSGVSSIAEFKENFSGATYSNNSKNRSGTND